MSASNVTTNALIKRINRSLAHQGEKLHVTRGERARTELGDYYVTGGMGGNTLLMSCVNLELLARQLGVLA